MNLKKFMSIFYVRFALFHCLKQVLATLMKKMKLNQGLEIGLSKFQQLVSPTQHLLIVGQMLMHLCFIQKNAKDPHTELMEQTLGCAPKQTATIQMETFESIVKSTVSADDELSEEIFIDIQENLNTMVEDHKEIYEDTDIEPITLSKEKVKNLLIESGVSEEVTAKIEKSYEEQFGDEPPLAENLVDTKLIKKNAQKKKEEQLITQIEELESKLEKVEKEAVGIEDTDDINDTIDTEDFSEETQEEQQSKDYDVVLHVKPAKLNTIKTELINGQRCIVIPIDDDEQATINGIEDLL